MSSLLIDTDTRGVTTLTLNRPEQHNAFDRPLIDALGTALSTLSASSRLLLLRGSGKSFCAGADLNWMKESVHLTDAQNREDASALSSLLHRLNTFPAPTIAVAQGAALGGGVGLVSCCDIALASDSAVFALSEVRLGLIPATISPYVIEAIGARAARRLFVTAERFSAATAASIGLIHESCADDALETQLDVIVQAILAGGPNAQRASKQLIAEVSGQINDDKLRANLVDRLASTRSGDEAQEGFAAFFAKRKPQW